MSKYLFLLSSLFFCFSHFFAQTNLIPNLLFSNLDNERIPIIEMPFINPEELLKQDEISHYNGDKTLRFGIPYSFNQLLEKISLIDTLDQEFLRFTTRIIAPQARGLHVIFDTLSLAAHARLYILNSEGEILQGPFEKKDIPVTGIFSTLPVEFNDIILCCIAPKAHIPLMKLSTIIQDYRSFNQSLKEFGSSQFCNINVNCPLGEPFQDIKRSVVMLLTSFNARFCSGAMITNTSNDGTPYVLTANHCEPAPSDIFLFNYESAGCTNQDGSTLQTVLGCSIIARSAATDFCLLELNEKPPSAYNAFLAGWNNMESPPNSGVFIHHPSGDIKKISFDLNPSQSDLFEGAICWATNGYSDGTTEPGSSGCPMFNANKEIVGQLFGGPASCFNNAGDFYGKLSQSWTGSNQGSRLHDWLDPNRKGFTAVSGIGNTFTPTPIDARLMNVTAPLDDICDNTLLNPRLRWKNMGTQTINSITISYEFNGNIAGSFTTTSSLSPGQTQFINLPSIFSAYGNNQTFRAWITSTNPAGDANRLNDTISTQFNMREGKRYRLILRTDERSLETSWRLENLFTGQQLFGAAAGTLAAERTFNYDLCVSKGCYKLVINDEAGDGICCASGNGNYSLRSETGAILESGGAFEFQKEIVFCVDTVISLQNIASSAPIPFYPNPANDVLFIDQTQQPITNSTIQLLDLQGRIIISHSAKKKIETINTSSLPDGVYLLRVSTSNSLQNNKIIIRH